ncbi:putative U-box domain-containing protein 50 [Acorus gramineus]|uniref:RING-type E3 ubiquitin transferase n=1 Tax=Acorus gramineus TaxID=55184 RepID=A0AAV9BEI0_ACOGR|nr:putative U-box domain-containing protein 50 [Acorus gramineus]
MDVQEGKVHVAVGKDLQEGLSTLEWALRRWSSQSISFVILLVNCSSKSLVDTPYGKLPASYVSEEKVKMFKASEDEKLSNLLSKYMVKSEVIRVEKTEEPVHKILIELVSKLHVTRLVMGITITKSSHWRMRSGISGSSYVHKNKPETCELFIVCGGRLLGEDDDRGGADARKKSKQGSIKGWLERISPRSLQLMVTSDKKEGQDFIEEDEVEEYFNRLLLAAQSLNSDGNAVSLGEFSPIGSAPELELVDANMSERIEAQVNEERAAQLALKRELDATTEALREAESDTGGVVRELERARDARADLERELLSRATECERVRARLEEAARATREEAREVEEARRRRDALCGRVELMKARESGAKSDGRLDYCYREFSADEVREATDNFSERARVAVGGEGMVYKGRINQTTVAIAFKNAFGRQSLEEFKNQMETLCQIRHPHVVTMIGACAERRCVVFEYMHNGSLQEILSGDPHKPSLVWHARVRIAAEVASAVAFLHSSSSTTTGRGGLHPSRILLDRNLVAKIACPIRDGGGGDEADDVAAFGELVTWLMEVGREGEGEWPREVEEGMEMVGGRCKSGGVTAMEAAEEMEGLRRRSVEVLEEAEEVVVEDGDPPSAFLCPIFREVMKNPYIAADGFSYEEEAIEEWLHSGHETSPMTNLRLKHKDLTPNHTLRSLINDWISRSPAPP